MKKQRNFEPWKADQRKSRVSILIAIALVGGGAWMFFAQHQTQISGSMMIFAMLFLILGARLAKRAKAREYGKKVEERFTPMAVATLRRAGLEVQTNMMARGLGDIDLVVQTNQGSVPIEIKSFYRWGQLRIPLLPATFWAGERERKALRQAEAQRQHVRGRHAIIWLPNGRMTFMQKIFGTGSRRVTVVFGHSSKLVPAATHRDWRDQPDD